MVKCKVCGEEFENKSELKNHTQKKHPEIPTSFLEEFMKFLEEYGVIGLAIAFVIGLAVKDLVSSVVDDVVMPIIEAVLPAGNWQTATILIGTVELQIGHLISSLIDFTIIALLIFAFVKYALKKKEVKKA